jgi:hypothetical protein
MQPLAIRGVLETVLILGRAATASLSSLRNSIASPPPPAFRRLLSSLYNSLFGNTSSTCQRFRFPSQIV